MKGANVTKRRRLDSHPSSLLLLLSLILFCSSFHSSFFSNQTHLDSLLAFCHTFWDLGVKYVRSYVWMWVRREGTLKNQRIAFWLSLSLSFEKKSFQETFSFVPQCETPREGFLSLSLDTISFTHRRHDLAQNVWKVEGLKKRKKEGEPILTDHQYNLRKKRMDSMNRFILSRAFLRTTKMVQRRESLFKEVWTTLCGEAT